MTACVAFLISLNHSNFGSQFNYTSAQLQSGNYRLNSTAMTCHKLILHN